MRSVIDTARIGRAAVFSAILLLAPLLGPGVAAQEPLPPGLHLQIGPVLVSPRLEIRDVGVDDNVFNDSENPQSDFTATIAPSVNANARLGWTRLTVGSFVHFIHFQDFADERSVNRGAEARFEVGESIIRPYVLGSIADTRERLNPEIDARAGRRQTMYGGGVVLALTSRSGLVVHARKSAQDFDEGESFRGVELSRTMNQETGTLDGGLRVALTSLTMWETTVGVQHDRFDGDPRRDADSRRVMTALEFSPSALISGRAAIGYRAFSPIDPSLPEFSGVIALVGAAYTLESTKLEGTFERDVRYSFEEAQPYYLATNGRFTATQRIAGPIDIQGTVGRYAMSYRAYDGGELEARRDIFTLYGGGVGYRLGESTRLGLNIEWSRRRSDELVDRHYDRRRIFGSLTYGL
jgi:hypothetical protein